MALAAPRRRRREIGFESGSIELFEIPAGCPVR
jgi:hypothetical protein